MPDPRYTKPWHGVPRESIDWHPTIIEDACIGCGTRVTGCSRMVYRCDFERQKAVVADPLNCMVGRTTCANLAWSGRVPHADRVINLEVAAMARPSSDILLLTLRPLSPADALCQFMSGQYPGASPAAERVALAGLLDWQRAAG